jgi:uncharacterized membrane protein
MFLVGMTIGFTAVGILALFGISYAQNGSGIYNYLTVLAPVSWILAFVMLFVTVMVEVNSQEENELVKRAEQACGQFKTEEGLSNGQKLYYRCGNDPQGSWRLVAK